MGHNEIEYLADQWDQMTSTVMSLKCISLSKVQKLLNNSYIVLTVFCKDEFIPKEISKLLLNMDEFLYFASLMEDHEVKLDFYHYQLISTIVGALKDGFFAGSYESRAPKLMLRDTNMKQFEIDLERDNLDKYIAPNLKL